MPWQRDRNASRPPGAAAAGAPEGGARRRSARPRHRRLHGAHRRARPRRCRPRRHRRGGRTCRWRSSAPSFPASSPSSPPSPSASTRRCWRRGRRKARGRRTASSTSSCAASMRSLPTSRRSSSMAKTARRSPGFAAVLHCMAGRSQRWMHAAAGISRGGLPGADRARRRRAGLCRDAARLARRRRSGSRQDDEDARQGARPRRPRHAAGRRRLRRRLPHGRSGASSAPEQPVAG